ncbi:MAG: copper resistance CopC/CopD family protein [Ilumatobacteraceae bacterium]
MRLIRSALLAFAMGCAVSPLAAGSVSAHSDFSGSEPADGSTISGPLDRIEMLFALPVLDRPGFDVLVDGSTVASQWSADGEDRTRWVGEIVDGVSSGSIQVVYAVTADDGHLIEGEVSFSVEGSTVSTAATPDAGDVVVATTMAPADEDAAVTTSTSVPEPSPAPMAGLSDERMDERVEHLARAVALLGVVLLFGLIFFSVAVLKSGVPGPFSSVVTVAALLVGLASVIELAAVADRLGLDVAAAVGDPLSRGPVIRLLAAVLLLLGFLAARSGSPAPMLVLGAASLGAVSFAFDGHAVSLGWRPLHAVSSALHVVAASVWVGSVVGLLFATRGDPLARRWVLARAMRLLPVTVGVIAVSGTAMTLMIHGVSLGLADSGWGRLLLVKSSIVVVAGLLGLRHHLAGRRGGSVGGWTLPVEAVTLLAVPVVTSWLVVAMP